MAIDPVTGGIISAGISGLGSLFGAKKDAERAAHAAVVASDRSDLQSREANAFTQGMSREANQFTQAERREQNAWNAEQIRLMNDYNNPANQRRLAEEAGFNPLIFAGAGTALQGAAASGGSGSGATGGAAQAQSYQAQQTSSGIADAFSAFGGGFADYAASKSEATLLRQQNDELRKTLTKQILRPAVGGIYGGGDVPLESLGGVKNPRLPSLSRSAGPTAPMSKDDKDAEAASNKGYGVGDKNGTLFGFELESAGLFTDGAWFSDKYGDVAESIVGMAALAADSGYTIGKNARRGIDKYIKSIEEPDGKKPDWKKYRAQSTDIYKNIGAFQPSFKERESALRQKYKQ